jgi:PAS domain S-box-containing protein
MLEQFSDHIRECYEFAAQARARADATDDRALKAEFLDTETRWLTLARSYGFTESLKDFTTENSERRRQFNERLGANIQSAQRTSLPENAERILLPETGEQILRSIVENSDDAIITKNLYGIISSWNKSAERLFGYTAQEAIGKPITILIPSERLDEEPKILARIRRGERIDHYETVRQRKDGSLIDVLL